MPTIWVDADACPKAVRDVIIRAAERTSTPTRLVANHQLPVPRSPWVQSLSVPSGADAADNLIVERAEPGDLVITSDLPLAGDALAKGAVVLTSRGEALTLDNIRARLNMRDFMETMRASGEHTGGPKALSERDIREFANAFDRQLAKMRQA
ncbi:YaiI/YqxD family protein [Phytohalomonas tamaricis]|uniref:YaiI/YqxD family protein n=1 Tax=Phytohalomonas tamaricis TaxID=2081032 RepID=UPI000D0B0B81|nr:YaiI/YqxD family protein [Phytohalomonas tamaricis]